MEYKITLWKDSPLQIIQDGAIVNEYNEEVLLFTLCSSDSTSPMLAYNPILTEKVNGDKELSFSINYKYYDLDKEDYCDNPLLGLLVNGRTVKLEMNGKIIPFIITKNTKSSDKKTLTFTCSNANILELARNGYNIELDTELENNMGTVFDLASNIVESTNWTVVDTEGVTLSDGTKIASDFIKSYNTEPLYVYELSLDLNATIMDNPEAETIIPSGGIIYISETSIKAKGNSIQFFYAELPETNEKRVIVNSPNYTAATPFLWTEAPTLISASYRGRILVEAPLYKYIPSIDKTCTQYLNTGVKYYGYDEPKFLSSVEIQNLISNNTNYTSETGWTGAALYKDTDIYGNIHKSLVLNFSEVVKNTGINSSKVAFADTKGLNSDYDFVFAIRFRNGTSAPSNIILRGRPNDCALETEFTTYYTGSFLTKAAFEASNNCVIDTSKKADLENYYFAKMTYQPSTAISYTDLLDSYIELVLSDASSGTKIMYDTMFFKYSTKKAESGNPILIIPDLTIVESSVITYTTYLFKLSIFDEKEVTSISDLTYETICDKTEVESKGYKVITNENYLLITSITAKESNRFNLLLDLCEKFQCWLNFYIDTTSTGRIKYKYQLTQDKTFQSGKRYFVLVQTPSETWFNDEYYHYANLDNYFDLITSSSVYNYSNRAKYYKKSNDVYVAANLEHQWKEADTQFYYATYVTDGTTKKQYTAVNYSTDEYSSSTTYYILENNKYKQVALTNDFELDKAEDEPTYCLMKYNNGQPLWKTLYERHYEKYIAFNEYTGNANLAGFKYGINLKQILRTLDNSELTTKLIVGMNNNECAEYGYCTIAEAALNYTGSNTLYDFYYYIDKGLIDEELYNADMYGTEPGLLGYLRKYTEWNENNALNTDNLSALNILMSQLTAMLDLYSNYLTLAKIDWENYVEDIYNAGQAAEYGSTWTYSYCKTVTKSSLYSDKINEYIDERDAANANIDKYKTIKEQYDGEVENRQILKANLEKSLVNDTLYKKALDREFFEKYSKYIHEGTWLSEDYYNADTYYAAAQEVLLTSAYPKVSYSFSVVDLSDLDGWNNYKFNIGDKTYVRDTEFFQDLGKASIEVIISQINWNLDNPLNTSILVTNYATAFEDLFQRVAASVQSLQYNEAKYDKAAAATSETDEGTEILSRILSNNNTIVTAANGKFVYDETGITGTDVNPQFIVKLTTRGLVVSNDGGENWQTGVSAEGINTQLLTAGTIDVNRINLFGGKRNATFTWDYYGLNAYTNSASVQKYVRFDKYGIYGVNGNAYNWEPTSINQIENLALFALTWKGLSLQSGKGTNLFVKINTAGTGTETVDEFKYHEFTGTSFDDNTTYYEEKIVNDVYCYFVTEDDTYNPAKTYYTRSIVSTTKTKIIDGGNNGSSNFVVYHDGSIKAASGIFTGIVLASDFLDLNGESILLNGLKIKHGYLDLGKIRMDPVDGYIVIASEYASKTSIIPATGSNYIKINDLGIYMTGEIHFDNAAKLSIIEFTGTEDLARAIANGEYTGGTFISGKTIYSPTIIGDIIAVKPKTMQEGTPSSGLFLVYAYDGTKGSLPFVCGVIGAAYGSTGSTVTKGVALAAGAGSLLDLATSTNYLICTTAGIRMQSDNYGLYLTSNGAFLQLTDRGSYRLATYCGYGSEAPTDISAPIGAIYLLI